MRGRDTLSMTTLLLVTLATLGTALPATAQRYLVKEINPAGWQGGVASVEMAVLGSQVLFGADDGSHGKELWISDGTAEGTVLVKDIWPPEVEDPLEEYSSSPDRFVTVGSNVYFTADVPPVPTEEDPDPYSCGTTLWVTDGTEAGTEQIPICPTQSRWAVMGPSLYVFAQAESFNTSLVKVTGSTYAALKELNTTDLAVVDFDIYGPRLVFKGHDFAHGWELWMSDGSGAGTVMLKDLNPGSDYSNPQHIVEFDGRAWFAARDADGDYELWVSDGSAAGTERFIDLNGSGSDGAQELETAGNHLFFCATDGSHGLELWSTDGTTGGTEMITETELHYQCTDHGMIDFGGQLVFRQSDDDHGYEPWISDGTFAGTHLLFDALPGPESSWPAGFFVAGDNVFFYAYGDSSWGGYLWVSDGTSEGTREAVAGGFGKAVTHNLLFFVGDYPGSSGGELFALPFANFVTVPEPPTGPYQVNTGIPYTYTTAGGSVSSDGNRVQYRFHWGEEGDSGWLDFGVLSAETTWSEEGGGGAVTVEARAEHTGNTSSESYPLSVSAVFEEIIFDTTLSGPTLGEAGAEYHYTLESGSNSDHPLEYYVDWNDGTPYDWEPFVTATGSIELAHAWDNPGAYDVVAKVRCQTHTDKENDALLHVEIEEEVVTLVSIDGPSEGDLLTLYDFTISGESNHDHDLQYSVEWGEGQVTDWTDFGSGVTSVQLSHAWSSPGSHGIQFGVRCAQHDIQDWQEHQISIADERIVDVSISGPSISLIDDPKEFTVAGRSTADHVVEFSVDWGDGNTSEFQTIDQQTDTATISHTWSTTGEKTVTLTVRCYEHSDVSESVQTEITITETEPDPETIEGLSIDGPAAGQVGQELEFTVSASSSEGHDLVYSVDWGDSFPAVWLPIDNGTDTATTTHTWSEVGDKTVTVTVRCADHTDVSDVAQTTVTITDQPLETIDDHTLEGPKEGTVGEALEFTVSATSSEGHDLVYRFDWDDDTETDWEDLDNGTDTAVVSHSWTTPGEYIVEVLVVCPDHEWANSLQELTVTITESEDAIFADNFEDGNCEAWTSAVGEVP
jgi:ELWxxDGT repeat protein